MSEIISLICNTFNGLFVLNSRHLAIIKVIILDTAILGFFAAIKGLRTHSEEALRTVFHNLTSAQIFTDKYINI